MKISKYRYFQIAHSKWSDILSSCTYQNECTQGRKKNKHRDDRKCIRFLRAPLFPFLESVFFLACTPKSDSDFSQTIIIQILPKYLITIYIVPLVVLVTALVFRYDSSRPKSLKKWAASRLWSRLARGQAGLPSHLGILQTAAGPGPSPQDGPLPEGLRPRSRPMPKVSGIYLSKFKTIPLANPTAKMILLVMPTKKLAGLVFAAVRNSSPWWRLRTPKP